MAPTPPPKLRPIVKVAVDGWRWLAARTEAFCERGVIDDLVALGFNAYAPLGCKFVYWTHTRKMRRPERKQFPVFCRYVFVGCPPGQTFGKHTVDKVEAVLSDSGGEAPVPADAIRTLNELELAGFWDETRPDNDRSIFKPGAQVTITAGAFAGFPATVDEVESEEKIRVLTQLFGQQTPVHLSACQIELSRL